MSVRTRVRRAGRIAGFVGVTATMIPAFVARKRMCLGDAARDATRDRWTRRWADALLRVFSIQPEVLGDGDHRPPGGRGRLVVANHRSAIDIALVLRTFGGFMVSRADLSAWPLVGPAARSVGTLFVDRADKRSGASVIRQMREKLAAGHTVCIFPEGTTFAGDEVRDFHPGGFVAAAGLDVDIVPVGIAYATGSGAAFVGETFGAHLSRMASAEPTRVVLSIGDAIVSGPRTRASDIARVARAAVAEHVVRARRAVDGARK